VVTIFKNKFYLHKTYLDCVDDAGNCFILYSATIKLSLLKMYYSAFIFSDELNQRTERSTFHKSSIKTHKQLLTFSSKYLQITGNWEKAEGAVESLLYSTPDGIVNWHCHHPLASCNVVYKGRSFLGLGYAETLFLSIKPWELPIDELRWGRFLAPGIAITWIHWAGPNPINKIYLNGKEFNDALLEADSVKFNEGKKKLVFSDISLIRHVKFSDHISGTPWLKIFLNKAILNSVESKYKSKSAFTDAQGATHYGWSIFEIVKWEH